MTNHSFLSEDYQVQEITFSSGVKVWVDSKHKTFKISGLPGIEAVKRQTQ